MAKHGDETAKDAGELKLIRQIRTFVARRGGRASARSGVALGIGDDCALLRVRPSEEVAVTTDLSIEGRHFRLEWHEPEAVGHRTLARGLSDLAAMGARPVGAFISLGLRKEMERRDQWVRRFYDGLLDLAGKYEVPLLGGDLAESPVVLADIVLVGAAPRGKALRRSGACTGDAIFVTGELGGAAAGLEHLRRTRSAIPTSPREGSPSAERNALLQVHLYPQPRVAQGLWLMRRGAATAAIDLSDGLSSDLRHICEESELAAEVEDALVPVAAGATLENALHGGEDYELLFTAAMRTRIPRTIAGMRVTRIGQMAPQRKKRPLVTLITSSGPQPLPARGWQHFS